MTKFKMTWASLSQEAAGKSGGWGVVVASWGLADQAVLQGHPFSTPCTSQDKHGAVDPEMAARILFQN